MEYLIRPERPEEYRKTEQLVREAFWNIYRPGCTEHYILHCFRGRPEFIAPLDLVMEKEGRIIGQIMYAKSCIVLDNGTELPTVTFGPVCIHPDFERKGFGLKLVEHSLKKAASYGAGGVVITGNIAFYGKAGFVPAKKYGIAYSADPQAEYLLVRELKPGFLKNVHGTFTDPEGYLAAEKDPTAFEQYDSKFPPKEKKKTATQLFS